MNASDSTTKTCTKCGCELPATSEFFGSQIHGKYGLRAPCKNCVAKYNRIYNAATREIRLVRKRAAYIVNRESILAYAAAYREKYPEKVAASYRAWSIANPGKVYRKTHPDEMAAICKAWREANPEKCSAHLHNRRARKIGNGGTHTAADMRDQYERQKGKCFYCHKKLGEKYHKDHVVPLVLNGSNSPENLVLSCPKCNLSKGSKHPQDFAGILF